MIKMTDEKANENKVSSSVFASILLELKKRRVVAADLDTKKEYQIRWYLYVQGKGYIHGMAAQLPTEVGIIINTDENRKLFAGAVLEKVQFTDHIIALGIRSDSDKELLVLWLPKELENMHDFFEEVMGHEWCDKNWQQVDSWRKGKLPILKW